MNADVSHKAYNLYSNAELVDMIKARQLQIAAPSQLTRLEEKVEQKQEALAVVKEELARAERKLSKKRDSYIDALHAQDAKQPRPFRFLELSAELRNQVYEYLLQLDDDQKCHPAILRTCKAIHGEAGSILYGGNKIEIRLYPDGVATLAGVRQSYQLKDYKWPEFLRKVRRLKFCFRRDLGYETRWDSASVRMQVQHARNRIVENVLFSLCKFLHGTHQLRQFEVDVAHCRWAYKKERRNNFPDLYAARLIEQPSCNIAIHNGGPTERAIPDPITGVRRNAISHAEAREYLCRAVRAMSDVEVQRVLRHALPRTKRIKLQDIGTQLKQAVCGEPQDYQLRSHDKLLLDFAGHVRRALCHRRWSHSSERTETDFHGSIRMVLVCAVELKATL